MIHCFFVNLCKCSFTTSVGRQPLFTDAACSCDVSACGVIYAHTFITANNLTEFLMHCKNTEICCLQALSSYSFFCQHDTMLVIALKQGMTEIYNTCFNKALVIRKKTRITRPYTT